MIRAGHHARQVLLRPVRLTTGETVQVTLVVSFDASGAVVDLTASLPAPDRISAAEAAGVALAQAIGAKLRKRGDLGVAELRRRAEASLDLLEQLEDIEATHGPDARRCLAGTRP
jgi:hypothetical protein